MNCQQQLSTVLLTFFADETSMYGGNEDMVLLQNGITNII